MRMTFELSLALNGKASGKWRRFIGIKIVFKMSILIRAQEFGI